MPINIGMSVYRWYGVKNSWWKLHFKNKISRLDGDSMMWVCACPKYNLSVCASPLNPCLSRWELDDDFAKPLKGTKLKAPSFAQKKICIRTCHIWLAWCWFAFYSWLPSPCLPAIDAAFLPQCLSCCAILTYLCLLKIWHRIFTQPTAWHYKRTNIYLIAFPLLWEQLQFFPKKQPFNQKSFLIA